jgi:hypothetical protein
VIYHIRPQEDVSVWPVVLRILRIKALLQVVLLAVLAISLRIFRLHLEKEEIVQSIRYLPGIDALITVSYHTGNVINPENVFILAIIVPLTAMATATTRARTRIVGVGATVKTVRVCISMIH